MPTIFGLPTAQEIEQQRFADAVRLFSQAAPGVAPAVMAGQGLGRGIGGLLGMQDPQIEMANRIQQVQQQLSQEGVVPGSDGFIQTVSQRLRAVGAFDAAAIVEQQGSKMEKAALDAENTRLRNEKLRRDMISDELAARELEGLTGYDRVLAKMADRPDSNTDIEKARSDVASALERAGIPGDHPELPRLIARGGRALHEAMRGAARTTTTRETFGGSVSTTTPEIPAGAADAIVARMLGGARPAASAAFAAPSTDMLPSRSAARAIAAPRAASASPGVGTVRTSGGAVVGDLTLDRAVEIGRRSGGSIPLNASKSPDRIARERGMHPDILKETQKEAATVTLPAVKKLLRSQNEIARIIQNEGAAHPNLINQYAGMLERAAAASGGDMLSSGTNLLAQLMRMAASEFDPEEQQIVAKLNRAVTGMVLTEKERQNLGALTGPDVGILNAAIQNPTGFLFRKTGAQGYFDIASGLTRELLTAAQESVSSTGLRGESIPAPHPWFRLGAHRAEVADIIEDMQAGTRSAEAGAKAMSRRLGFPVSVKGAEMISATGKYAPRGGALGSAARAVEDVVGAGDALLDRAMEIVRPTPPADARRLRPEELGTPRRSVGDRAFESAKKWERFEDFTRSR